MNDVMKIGHRNARKIRGGNLPIELILNIYSLSTSLSCIRSMGRGGNFVAISPVGVGTQPIFHTIGGVLAKLFNKGILERPRMKYY